MEYMFLLYSDNPEFNTAENIEKAMDRHRSIIGDASARGVFRSASPLEPVRIAMTARPANGKITVLDGPFAETKETLGGYYIIDCKDADEASYWAGRIAETGCATAVEFRPLFAKPDLLRRAAGELETADAVNA